MGYTINIGANVIVNAGALCDERPFVLAISFLTLWPRHPAQASSNNLARSAILEPKPSLSMRPMSLYGVV